MNVYCILCPIYIQIRMSQICFLMFHFIIISIYVNINILENMNNLEFKFKFTILII